MLVNSCQTGWQYALVLFLLDIIDLFPKPIYQEAKRILF